MIPHGDGAKVSSKFRGDGLVFRARSDIAAGEELRFSYFGRKAGTVEEEGKQEVYWQYTTAEVDQGHSLCPQPHVTS